MSSAQANTVATREIEAEPAPSRFARGWHCFGLSRDFKDGNPHRVRAFGQKLAVFRGSDGKLNVLEGYCRHMGGDLTMGEVKGDEIACPFHDWRWGGDGRCKQVPYSRRVPRLRGPPPGPLWTRTECFLRPDWITEPEVAKMRGTTSVASYCGPSFMIDDLTYHYADGDQKTVLIDLPIPDRRIFLRVAVRHHCPKGGWYAGGCRDVHRARPR